MNHKRALMLLVIPEFATTFFRDLLYGVKVGGQWKMECVGTWTARGLVLTGKHYTAFQRLTCRRVAIVHRNTIVYMTPESQ